jgi:hypothetical protein
LSLTRYPENPEENKIALGYLIPFWTLGVQPCATSFELRNTPWPLHSCQISDFPKIPLQNGNLPLASSHTQFSHSKYELHKLSSSTERSFFTSVHTFKMSTPPPTSPSPLPLISALDSNGEKYIKISIAVAFAVLILAAGVMYWVIKRRWRGNGGRSENQMGELGDLGGLGDVGGLGDGSGNASPKTKRREVVGESGSQGEGGEVGAKTVT